MSNHYETITNQIIAQIEAGILPWVQPWANSCKSDGFFPYNAASGRAYNGINILLGLGAVHNKGFTSKGFMTYKQAQELGGQVRKGSKATAIYFSSQLTKKDNDGNETDKKVWFFKSYSVFNLDQIDGLPENLAKPLPSLDALDIDQNVSKIIKSSLIDFRILGNRAFYSPAHDFVQVPHPDQFPEKTNWHATTLHELGHATGHKSRLDRDLSHSFGSTGYAYEELIAEITAAFLCASLGIAPTVRHADYVGSWLKVLKNDSRAIVRAASAASKASNWLLDRAGLLQVSEPEAVPCELAA